MAVITATAMFTFTYAMAVDSNIASVGVVQERIEADTSFTTTLSGETVVGLNLSATGTTCPGIEATSANPFLGNANTIGNYAYGATLKESSETAWISGTIYRVKVFGDGNLLSTNYLQNAVEETFLEDDLVEGVTLQIDTGSNSDTVESYTMILDPLDECP